ncbi:DUF1156 domain-containing protein [Nocardia jejuensis]|uniref:DUF1156 domain-containing protein n=1 Tax=Nocardia jejuensis TaxID=328049 RepID=UPI0008315985|nr:DUF1156 domain-containing protein [Nocardia jejuensis]
MTRMIERWFPCTEVSETSKVGWGSGNTEAGLWVWFAKRPTAQARAAVLTSLLPWPEDEADQLRLQQAVRELLAVDRPARIRAAQLNGGAMSVIRSALSVSCPDGARVLDPFSGRAMIPLEAGRLGLEADGIDYSPFAALGGYLLAQAPFQDYSAESSIPYPAAGEETDDRLVSDVASFLAEVGRRYTASMTEFYPRNTDRAYPWGYLWASTLPCEECGRRFPLVGELWLRHPRAGRASYDEDLGQSFEISVDRIAGTFRAEPHPGMPHGSPTRVFAGKSKYASDGRVAVCPFCEHVHSKAAHTRLSAEGLRRDTLLIAADIALGGMKVYRQPTEQERRAAKRASLALAEEVPFAGMPARPDELIPAGNTWTIQSVNYGDRCYGDLISDRQTLGLIHLARAINDLGAECLQAGVSPEYVRVLSGYATAAMMRKIRRSTRGSRLEVPKQLVGDVFANQSAILHAYDWFEPGLSDGPGSWASLAKKTVQTLRSITRRGHARPAQIQHGSALVLPYRDEFVSAVVTDPPYDDMIDYSDSSDLFYVWAKRAMATADFALSLTSHPNGVQDKADEIIVKRGGGSAGDHRTKVHYEKMISRAYAEMRRVVAADGVVTIVFGHGDVEVWNRMLTALDRARLVMTASWPAKTESGGGGAGSSNIVTTVTMACRPAPLNREIGRLAVVEGQIKRVVAERFRLWERSDLARGDMLMAACGPAMEVAGQYERILNNVGEPVDLLELLGTARRAVQENALSKIDTVPLGDFDERTQFALWWVEVNRRQQVPKSELRWAALASGLPEDVIRTLVKVDNKGCRFIRSDQFTTRLHNDSAAIDIALALARAWRAGDLQDVANELAASGKEGDDEHIWATIAFLSAKLPEADPDTLAWAELTRVRRSIIAAAHNLTGGRAEQTGAPQMTNHQVPLF